MAVSKMIVVNDVYDIPAPLEIYQAGVHQAAAERRSGRRHACEAGIDWTVFNMEPNQKGVLKNYSSNGLYLELGEVLGEGTYLLVTIGQTNKKSCATDSSDCFRINAIAEVKWCREVQSGHHQLYQVGLKYLRPI